MPALLAAPQSWGPAGASSPPLHWRRRHCCRRSCWRRSGCPAASSRPPRGASGYLCCRACTGACVALRVGSHRATRRQHLGAPWWAGANRCGQGADKAWHVIQGRLGSLRQASRSGQVAPVSRAVHSAVPVQLLLSLATWLGPLHHSPHAWLVHRCS